MFDNSWEPGFFFSSTPNADFEVRVKKNHPELSAGKLWGSRPVVYRYFVESRQKGGGWIRRIQKMPDFAQKVVILENFCFKMTNFQNGLKWLHFASRTPGTSHSVG